MTNGDFFYALEIMGYETLEDCPLSEEQVENVAKSIAVIVQERDEAQADLKEAVETLKSLEWASRDNGYPYCPACLQSKRHGPGCTIFDVLAKHPTL